MSNFTVDDEKEVNNIHSPGVVQDEEILYRVTLHPEHVDENGKVLPAAIASDDLKSRGFSVERKDYCNIENITKLIDRQIKNSPDKRDFAEIAYFGCGVVRQFYFPDDNNIRSFVVIDQALSNNNAHASIYSALSSTKKSDIKKIKQQLLPLLQTRFCIDDF